MIWAGEESGGFGERVFAGLLPVERGQLTDLLVGRGWQACQDVFEVGQRIDAVHAAVFDQGIHHRAALAGFFRTEKQPVLFSDSGGADRVFDQVVVDLHLAMLQEAHQCRPLIERVADGFAH